VFVAGGGERRAFLLLEICAAGVSRTDDDDGPGAGGELKRGGVETARNVGGQPYREIIIELKD